MCSFSLFVAFFLYLPGVGNLKGTDEFHNPVCIFHHPILHSSLICNFFFLILGVVNRITVCGIIGFFHVQIKIEFVSFFIQKEFKKIQNERVPLISCQRVHNFRIFTI